MSLTPEADGALMRRVQEDDADAFGALYDRFSRRAFHVALAVARDRSRAEDVVQEAFLSVWRSRGRFRPDLGTPSAWLLSIVRHQALDAVKADARHSLRRSEESRLDTHLSGDVDLEDRTTRRDETARMRRRVAELPNGQREAIALAYYGQLTTREISQALGIPQGTVKSRIRLGLGRLREIPVGDGRGAQPPTGS